jgi:hypothetical protein
MLINVNTLAYPLTMNDVRAAKPNAIISLDPSDADLAAMGFGRVVATSPAAHNAVTHGAREIAPALIEGKYVQQWEIYALDFSTVAARMAEAKAELVDQATAKRWEIETGGIILANGIQVKTSVEDQNRISSVIVNASRAGLTSVDFKSADGWVTVSVAQLEAIADAIALHVQQCFSAERAHHDAIEQLATPEAVASYDVNAGWPDKQKP